MKVKTIFSQSGADIVVQPYLVGKPLEKAAHSASADFVRSLDMSTVSGPVVALNILRGGKFYFIKDAWDTVKEEQKGDKDISVVSLRASRYQDPQDQKWKVKISQQQGQDLLQKARTIIIGDTIATGATLDGVLRWVVDTVCAGKDSTPEPVAIHIFSIAGGHVALDRLKEVDAMAQKRLKSEISLTYANAIFNLADNGTDLQFTAAKMDPKFKTFVDQKIGGFAGKMKCAVWDWGDRFYGMKDHVHEVAEYFEALQDTPDWLRKGLEEAKKQVQKA